MSYAINATQTGWRAINSQADLLPGEIYSDTQPVLAPSIGQAQAAKAVELGAAYAAAVSAPVSFTTAGKVTASFQADAGSVANVQATLLGLSATQATPPGFFWVAADNSQVPFTYADIQGLAAAMLAQGWAAFKRLQTAKAAVRAATTVAAVQAVTF